LPAPDQVAAFDPLGSWRDIELGQDNRVRFRRRLCVDLGGIAKGYAVDRALEMLPALGAVQACVNAGGDLAVFGPGRNSSASMPRLQTRRCPCSKSKTRPWRAAQTSRMVKCRTSTDDPAARSQPAVSFPWSPNAASFADALTKIVLALDEQSEPIFAPLRGLSASA